MTVTRTFLAVLVAGSLCLLVPDPAVAAPVRPDPPIVVTPTNPYGTVGPPSIGVGVRDAGAPGGPAARGGADGRDGAGAASESSCRWVLAPDVEQWIRRIPSQISTGVGPARVGRAGGGGQDTVDPAARLYQQVCNGLAGDYQWFGPAQPGVAAVALPTPAELAQQAYAQLRLPVPTPEHSPDLRPADGRAAVLVGEHTWVWTDRSRFRAQSRRLQVGPVWAQVTATPVGLSFDPGNGAPAMTCSGPGTPYAAGRWAAHAASPTCDYLYPRSSAGSPGGVVTAGYGIRWQVRWTGSTGTAGAGGQLPEMTSRSTTDLAVAEAQALGTSGVQR